jgi:hypothetical protein
MLKMSKINGLVATYNDRASSDAEQNSSRNLICKSIEKELDCKRWVSANIFQFLVEGEAWFNDYKCKLIGDENAYEKVVASLTQLGFNYTLESFTGLGETYKHIYKV